MKARGARLAARERRPSHVQNPRPNVSSRSLAQEDTTRPEHSPDGSSASPHTSAETARVLHPMHRPDEPRRPRYTRHKFTSSVASTPSTRPCPSNVTEESIVWSGIAKHRSTSPESKGRRPSDAETKQAIGPTAPEDLGRYLEEVHDESQSRMLPKQETPGKLSRASEKRGKYKGSHPAPETGRLTRQGVAAARLDEQSRHEDASHMQAPLLTGAQPVSTTSKSSPTFDYQKRRRPSATPRVSSRPPRDTKDHTSSTVAFTLPGALQGDRKTNAITAMGDVVCYAARSSKIQMDSTTTSSRHTRRGSSATRSSQDLSSRDSPLGSYDGQVQFADSAERTAK
ncbi:hypothetical protein MTO96_015607 [Rhipicephalus appendiculatus]